MWRPMAIANPQPQEHAVEIKIRDGVAELVARQQSGDAEAEMPRPSGKRSRIAARTEHRQCLVTRGRDIVCR
jgi:hypothetical protein